MPIATIWTEINGEPYNFTIEYNPTDTILNIKQRIYQGEGFPVESQKLYFLGKEKPDNANFIQVNPYSDTVILKLKPASVQQTSVTRLMLYPFASIIQKFSTGQIQKYEIQPQIQGITYSPNMIMTFYTTNGNVYYVELKYDPLTNMVYPPQ